MQPSVLLVDDDKGAREIYGRFFSRAGWRYDLVSDGQSAIDAASQNKYDVILTDLMMPGLSGFEVLKTLKQASPHQAVIVVTGSANVQDVIDSLREGASDILLKPISYDTLRQAVERLTLSLRRQQGEDKNLYRYVTSESSVFELTAADLASLKFQVGILDRLFNAGRIDHLLRLRLHLAVQEAISNSLDHGALELESAWKEEFDEEGFDKFTKCKEERLKNPSFADRKITIRIEFDENKLTITIRDPGKGFPLRKNAPIENEGRKLICHGRGLAIIAGTMDEVQYQEGGAEITMVKYLV